MAILVKIMETKKLIKLNVLLFALYLGIYFIAKFADFELITYLRTVLGIAVFLITGFNCAVAIKSGLKLRLDLPETLLVSVTISLFLIPLALFLAYKVLGSINEWLNISVYIVISLGSLIFLKYKEKNADRKI